MLKPILLLSIFISFLFANIPLSNDTTSNSYDAQDNRIAKITNNITTTYLIDTNTPFAQVITESKENGTEIHYTYGNDLISDNTYYFLTDALGSTRGLVDSDEELTDSYDYKPYGELLAHNGTSDNDFLFTGEQLDQETDNYYLRARYYSPSLARFLSRDTYDGKASDPLSQNHYLYAGGNPVLYVDLSGHCYSMASMSNTIAVMGILGGGAIATGLFNSRGGYSGNIQATIWMYNASQFLYEEYIDFSIYWAGKATEKSPFGHAGEREALSVGPNDPCLYIKKAIEILEAQIAWRYSDIRPGTQEAKGHYKRIKILEKHLEKLKNAYNMWCKK